MRIIGGSLRLIDGLMEVQADEAIAQVGRACITKAFLRMRRCAARLRLGIF